MGKTEKAARTPSAGKSKTENTFASLYKSFSSKKLEEYRLKYPKLRQSDLVSKILKEWQALDTQKKSELQKEMLSKQRPAKRLMSLRDAFIKQKLDQYKAKFPKLGKTDIMKKIQQEWGGLDTAQKNILTVQYSNKGFLEYRASSSSNSSKNKLLSKEKVSLLKDSARDISSGLDRKLKAQKQRQAQKSGSRGKSGIKAVKEQQSDKSKNGSEFNRQNSKSPGSKKKSSKSKQEGQEEPRHTKVINYDNLKNGAYIQFFKYYYARLAEQHTNWTPVQISSIIKLLWKKRSKKEKKSKLIKKELKEKRLRPVSGRMAFKRAKLQERSLRGEEINGRWKQLPRQSKIAWEKKGNSWRAIKKDKRQAHKQTKKALNSGQQTDTMDIQTNLNFMGKKIQ